jgi:hypothetical protein
VYPPTDARLYQTNSGSSNGGTDDHGM